MASAETSLDPVGLTSPVRMFDFGVLRELRRREELTLAEVAERSGVSVAVISKLERNQSAAELETLARLGRVFGMRGSDLLALAEAPLAHRTREDTPYRRDGFSFRVVRYGNLSVFHVEASEGAHVSTPEVHHDDLELCWVITGTLRVKLPLETIEVEAGSCIQFDAIQEHTYEALTATKLVLVHQKKETRF